MRNKGSVPRKDTADDALDQVCHTRPGLLQVRDLQCFMLLLPSLLNHRYNQVRGLQERATCPGTGVAML